MVTFLAETAINIGGIGFSPLNNVLTLLENFGFFRVVLPFLLVFALSYAVLMKAKVLGDPDKSYVKSVNAIVSLAIGFFVIASTPVVNLMMTLIPQASFMLVVTLFIVMIATFIIPSEWTDKLVTDKRWLAAVVIILVVIFLGIVGSATPDIPILHGLAMAMMGNLALPELTPDVVATILAVLVIIGIPAVIIGMLVWGKLLHRLELCWQAF